MSKLRQISEREESNIRYECRVQYNADGTLDNPYERGTMPSLVWGLEASELMKKEMLK